MWTEEMEKILTSPAARRIVPRLSPVYGNAYVALWLINTIGNEIDNMELQTQELMLQALPQTATWGIGYWEEDYGISYNNNLSTEERRREVLSRIRTRAPMNPQWVKLVLETLTGITVQIVENISKNRFEVIFEDVLDNSVKTRVRSKLEEIKPAHLIYLLTQIVQIRFSEYNSSSMFPEVTFHSLNQEKIIEKASNIHFPFQNIQSTAGDLVYNRPWKFNGRIRFNGNHKFNSGVTEEAF
jgi:hypothetical protein